MKRTLRIFSLIMAMFFFFANSSPLLAINVNATTECTQCKLTNDTVTKAVATYFDTRADYLLGKTSSMIWSVDGIAKDEQLHLAKYEAMGIVPVQTTFTIKSMDPPGCCIVVFAVETVTYEQNGQQRSEDILHELWVYPNGTELPLVSADCYAEACTGFTSCSYLPPSMSNTSSYCTSSSFTTLWSVDSEHLVLCNICGESEWSTHQYTKPLQHDSTYHWQTCKCGKMGNYTLHTMVGDGLVKPKTCSVCGYTGAYGEIVS